MKRQFKILGMSAIFAVYLFADFAAFAGNIDAIDKYSWSANSGWCNMEAASGSVTVYDDSLSGFAWNENTGWIKFGNDAGGPYNNTNETDWGVNNDGVGNLSGYAWSATCGWINFSTAESQVKIDTSGDFSGYAWNENTGWIHFSNAAPVTYKVATSWTPSYTVTAASAGNGTVAPLTQIVIHGDDAAVITATPAANYNFIQWDDGNTDNPRTLTNVTADIAVTGNFTENILTVNILLATIPEQGGSSSGTVTRNSTVGDLIVNLASNDITKAIVTGTVTILDGNSSANFTITAVEDAIVDEIQTVTITASATNFTDGTDTIDVSSDLPFVLTVTQGTGSGNYLIGTVIPISADAPQTGQSFDKWTGTDVANIADVNAADTSISMPGADTTITATYVVDSSTAPKVTIGTKITVDASEISGMDSEFTSRPAIYGRYIDPVKLRAFKVNTRGITRIAARAQNNKFECEWRRAIYLYDKRARLAANKFGKSTAQWISELSSGKIDDLEVTLWAKAKTIYKSKLNVNFRGKLITSPIITGVTSWDGNALGDVHTKSIVIVKGTYFGNKAPLVSLEYLDPIKGVLIKQKRLKVLRPYKYSDSRGRIEKSCMDLDSVTGESEIRVELPSRWWRGWLANSYDLILDNKIGLATYTISTIASSVSNPVANNDTVTLIHGDASYYIDVLANDTDADSDGMIIIPEEDKTTRLGGRIVVSKHKMRYTPPKKVLPNAFPDDFTYNLRDIHGGVSASVATVTINMNAITLDPVKHWDGTALTIGSRTVQPGSRIILSGSNFGVRVPTVTMAVETDKILKLKVVSKAQYIDSKGKAKKSYTNLSTGDSEITVELPKKAWVGYTNSTPYTITVRNKFDTTGAGNSVTTSAGNTAPTANPDSVDLFSGEKCYYIDVLGNNSSSTSVVFPTNGVDTDAESDKLTIILPLKKSNLGARLIVDRITNTIRYTRVKGELCNFTDSFEYYLMDPSGATSGIVTVNITGKSQ